MWTAFGIMLGYVMDVSFYHVPDKPHITGLNWRLMLASVCSCKPGSRGDSYPFIIGWCPCTIHYGTSILLPRISSLVDLKGPL